MSSGKICLLSQEVIDRIAAGEVVQRPVSVVKELLENCLDAGATRVVVTFTPPPTLQQQHCGKISVSDNGSGIRSADLPLAAQRHATSKLRSVQDFDSLDSFGFRGEALASVSMVSRLQITSRTADSASGYTMTYIDGKPTQSQPTPRARPTGTTVTVADLFYNLKQRRPSRDDFRQMLQVMQKYAVLCASRGVGLVCEKAGKQADLNTAMGLVTTLQQSADGEHDQTRKDLQIRATKQVIAMIYGSSLESRLQYFECHKEYADDNMPPNTAEASNNEPHKFDQPYLYSCHGVIALPSHALEATKKEKPQFILFINQRLVDSRPIQRALEDVYAQFCASKPAVLFLAVQVPPTAVDVNIHPNKRECALLNLDAIVQSLAEHLKQVLSDAGQSFAVETTTTKQSTSSSTVTSNPSKRRPSNINENSEPQLSQSLLSQAPPLSQTMTQKSVPSSKKIRTSRATQSGALEPFLVRKLPLSQAYSISNNTQSSWQGSEDEEVVAGASLLSQDNAASEATQNSTNVHQPGCPLLEPAGVDLTQPGAFAAVSSQCTCNMAATGAATAIRVPRQALSRPRRVPPKECHYTSIQSLRNSVQSQTDEEVQQKLRKAYFVGVVSSHRSLVQVGEELVMLNHERAAQELFYQLALNHFPGGANVATVGPIDVHAVVAHCVQTEESLQSASKLSLPLKISETNKVLAEQAAACLLEQAAMLQEYFSIVIEKDEQGRAVLRGLPVLLEGYAPSPHALPLFLLRLATEVCWTEEKQCFHNVCAELGRFYASSPTDDHLAAHVRHTLFPALTSLLSPRKKMAATQGFAPVTKLSKLYRVFERC